MIGWTKVVQVHMRYECNKSINQIKLIKQQVAKTFNTHKTN